MADIQHIAEIDFMSAKVATLLISPVFVQGDLNVQDSTLRLKLTSRNALVLGTEDEDSDPFWVAPDGLLMVRDFFAEEIFGRTKEESSDCATFNLADFVDCVEFSDKTLNTQLQRFRAMLITGGLFERLGAEQALFPGLKIRKSLFSPATSTDLKQKKSKKKQKNRSKGFVYLIGNLEQGSVKIGFSSNPSARLKGIQTGCPFQVFLLAAQKGSLALERQLHKQFAQFRDEGEWFTVTKNNWQLFADAFSGGIQAEIFLEEDQAS